MRTLLELLAVCVVALSDASAYRWRLSEQQVVAIAERAIVAKHSSRQSIQSGL